MSFALASTFSIRIAVLAFRASGGLQGLCMAIAAGRAAMVNAAHTFIGNAGVRTVVTSKPVIRCMAACTIGNHSIPFKQKQSCLTTTL
jgi:hypothetical protein